jgi:hypothetical protein
LTPYSVLLVEVAERFQTKQQQKYFNRDVKKPSRAVRMADCWNFRQGR